MGFCSFEHLNKEQRESGSREGGGSPFPSISPSETWTSAQGSSQEGSWEANCGSCSGCEVHPGLWDDCHSFICALSGASAKRVHQSRVTRSWKMLVTLGGGLKTGDPPKSLGSCVISAGICWELMGDGFWPSPGLALGEEGVKWHCQRLFVAVWVYFLINRLYF